MTALFSKFATAAGLAVAAFPIVALGFAHAQPVAIRIADLNMSRPADVAVYEARVEHAADKICGAKVDHRDFNRMAACRAAVRAEAADKLAKAGRVMVASR